MDLLSLPTEVLDLIWAKARFASARRSLAFKFHARTRPRFTKRMFKGHVMHTSNVHFKLNHQKSMILMRVDHHLGPEGHYAISTDSLPLTVQLHVNQEEDVHVKIVSYETQDCWFDYPPWGGWYDYNALGIVPH